MEKVTVCRTCDLAQRLGELPDGAVAECARCGTELRGRIPHSLARTTAFSVAALILYFPANVYPILKMERYGIYTENTILDGCQTLVEDGMWPLALIVFVASFLVPLLKLAGLFFLVMTVRWSWNPKARTRLHRLIDVIGPWAMLDVFLLAILVSLLKLGQMASVVPGKGALAFAAVVVLTILASNSFDTRLIWEEEKES